MPSPYKREGKAGGLSQVRSGGRRTGKAPLKFRHYANSSSGGALYRGGVGEDTNNVGQVVGRRGSVRSRGGWLGAGTTVTSTRHKAGYNVRAVGGWTGRTTAWERQPR
jgi:hypothetical protein